MRKLFLMSLCLITTLFAENDCEYEICSPPSWEEQCALLSQINCESRRLYNSLDCEGKNRAIELSAKLRNKNRAVQLAAKEMAKRQRDEYPNQDTYQKQIRARSGQKGYSERFGS